MSDAIIGVSAINFEDPTVVRVLDQRLLPGEEVSIECRDGESMAKAIEQMVLRGAPLIGISAAMGLAVEFINNPSLNNKERGSRFSLVSERLAATRPTAVNLFWGVAKNEACP